MEIQVARGVDISSADIETAASLLAEGGQVSVAAARQRLPAAHWVGIARDSEGVVGVGAIKDQERAYIDGIAGKAKHTIPVGALEVGYLAVAGSRRGEGIGTRLTMALLQKYSGPGFSTTRTDAMKHILEKQGFRQVGREWPGERPGLLSLWIRP